MTPNLLLYPQPKTNNMINSESAYNALLANLKLQNIGKQMELTTTQIDMVEDLYRPDVGVTSFSSVSTKPFSSDTGFFTISDLKNLELGNQSVEVHFTNGIKYTAYLSELPGLLK